MSTQMETPILIVDDEEVALYRKARMFRQAGYDVLEATTGHEALELVQRHKPRLVLLDINLPDIDGWEVCRRIKADPQTAFVLVLQISATYSDEDHQVRSLEGGADACLAEPSNPSVLRATVRAMLRARQAEDDLREALQREQTARAAAEESRIAAEAANRAKDEFLATLSHELRSPLGTILTWSTLLRTGELDAARTARALESIERNARLQTQLMEDLLDVSRITSGQMSLDLTPVQLGSLAESALESARPLAESGHVTLQSSIEAGGTPILGDPTRLQQVLWNLLANAIKFTPAGGTVTLDVARGQGEVVIEVRDTGVGIAPEFLPFIFDRFRQADSSSTRSQGGLGLGLAIVRHVVEQHGGTVEAHSEGPGRGARFVVRLPERTPPRDAAPARSAARGESGAGMRLDGIRVLVVDDEDDAREGTATILETAGATVQSAGSTRAAIDVWHQFTPDVLVSDIAMPGEDGIMLLREVSRLAGGSTPFPAVAVTAYARAEDQRRLLAAGYRGYVSKPIEARTLVGAVAGIAREIQLREP